MQIPKRRAQMLRQQDDTGPVYLTGAGFEKLKRDIADLERQKPQAIEEVVRTAAQGDFSENAEYQEAKFRLRRIDSRIFMLKERIKRVSVIEKGLSGDVVQMGSTVVVEVGGKQKTYEIVGPQEANPTRGRISYVSPLGVAMQNHQAGDTVTVVTAERTMEYKIIEVR